YIPTRRSSDLKAEIIQAFGKDAYTDDQVLNRAFLADKVFSDEENTKTINSLVHPAVRKDFQQWANEQQSPYVLKEAALLFESGFYKELDKIINVSSPLKIRIARILLRDPQRTLEQVNRIIDKHLPAEDRNALAEFIIKNSQNTLIIPQIIEMHQKLLEDASTK